MKNAVKKRKSATAPSHRRQNEVNPNLEFVEDLLEYSEKRQLEIRRVGRLLSTEPKAKGQKAAVSVENQRSGSASLGDIIFLDEDRGDGGGGCWPVWKQHLFQIYIKNTVDSYFAGERPKMKSKVEEKKGSASIGVNCKMDVVKAKIRPNTNRIIRTKVVKITNVSKVEKKDKNKAVVEKDPIKVEEKVDKELWKDVFEKNQLSVIKLEEINIVPSCSNLDKTFKKLNDKKENNSPKDDLINQECPIIEDSPNEDINLRVPNLELKFPESIESKPGKITQNKFISAIGTKTFKLDHKTDPSLSTSYTKTSSTTWPTFYENQLNDIEKSLFDFEINPNYLKVRKMIQSCFNQSSESLESSDYFKSKYTFSTDDCQLVSPNPSLFLPNPIKEHCHNKERKISQTEEPNWTIKEPELKLEQPIISERSFSSSFKKQRNLEKIAFESDPRCKKVLDKIRRESEIALARIESQKQEFHSCRCCSQSSISESVKFDDLTSEDYKFNFSSNNSSS